MAVKIIVWLVLCLIWGTTWLAIKIGLAEIPPFTFVAYRFTLSIALVGLLLASLKIPPPKGRKEWNLVLITGILQFSINYSLVFWSETHISSGLAAVLQATIPVFGLLFAAALLPNERFTAFKFGAILLGIVGVGVIFYDQLEIENLNGLLGSAGIVVGAVAAASASILTKAKGDGMHPVTLLYGQMVCGVGPIVVYALVVEGSPLAHKITWKGIACILYLVVAGTIVSFWLYYWLLKRVESTKAMTIALVTPMIAVFAGAIFLGEVLSRHALLGGFLILGSVGLIILRKSRPVLVSEENSE
ncbi:MAG: EamA family transporter [Pyrinomonadaceae bacterium]